MSNEKIAFIGWNPFQFRHISGVASNLEGCFFIVEDRSENLQQFDKKFFENENINIVIWPSKELYKLDGVFDLFICQVPFPGIEKIHKTKIMFVQYGYAKDPHNYGIWRAFGEVTCTYGSYASKRIKTFCSVVETGNPECDKWKSDAFHKNSYKKYNRFLIENKKVALYAPTWGDISSIEMYFDSIVQNLTDEYVVFVKLHHNTDLIEKKRQVYKNNKDVIIAGANDDIWELLSVSNVLISDYSGAIFDGIFAERPIVLLNVPNIFESVKEDICSLEIKERNKLGAQVESPIELKEFDEILNKAIEVRANHRMKEVLFSKCENSATEIAEIAKKCQCGEFKKTQSQIYIRDYLQKTYKYYKGLKK